MIIIQIDYGASRSKYLHVEHLRIVKHPDGRIALANGSGHGTILVAPSISGLDPTSIKNKPGNMVRLDGFIEDSSLKITLKTEE